MKIRRYLAVAVLAVLIVSLIGFIIWGGRNKSEPSRFTLNGSLEVVAAENFWGSIALQLGGDHVNVTSIISDPEVDPHLYESNANNAAAITKADVVIINGVGYDDFMNKMLAGSSDPNRRVITVADALGVTNITDNPHLWYDITRMHLVAERITETYKTIDPVHSDDYETNLNKFNNSLRPLLDRIDQIKQRFAGSAVVYTEPVAGYVIQAAGLKDVTPEGFAKAIEETTEPSPADTAAIKRLFEDHTARLFLYNSQTTSQITEDVKNVAKGTGVPIVGVTETMPPQYKTYQSWQQAQLDEILEALEASGK